MIYIYIYILISHERYKVDIYLTHVTCYKKEKDPFVIYNSRLAINWGPNFAICIDNVYYLVLQ